MTIKMVSLPKIKKQSKIINQNHNHNKKMRKIHKILFRKSKKYRMINELTLNTKIMF